MSRAARLRARGPFALALLVAVLLGGSALGLVGMAGASPSPGAAAPSGPLLAPVVAPAAYPPLTGSVTGPTVLGYNVTDFYAINATGGPAVNSTGVQVGNITYYSTVTATNVTGVSFTPEEGAITNATALHASLTVSNISETVTINVMISSVYLDENESINLTYAVLVVQPYQLTASLVASPSYTVLSFQIDIYLDGSYAGVYTVPTLTAGEVYTIDWSYPSAPLPSGWHTFTLSIPTADKGLVTFPNGQYTYSYSFYITGPGPNYTLWIVLAVLAFIAVAFISLIILGGRRRNRGRS